MSAQQLGADSQSHAAKRARSSDHSANGSPAPDILGVEDDIKLPIFLRQSKAGTWLCTLPMIAHACGAPKYAD